MYKIYCLLDPTTYVIRYVGATSKSLEERLKGHMKKSPISHKTNWIKSLNVKPIIELLQEIPEDYWQQAEIYWIAYFKSIGCNLTNTTTGGEGVPFTEDVKAKHKNNILAAYKNNPTLAIDTSKRMQKKYDSMTQAQRDSIAARARTGCTEESFKKIHEQTRKEYKFTDPNGYTYIAKGLNKFCREHNLNQAYMCKVIKGVKPSYKGWTAIKL